MIYARYDQNALQHTRKKRSFNQTEISQFRSNMTSQITERMIKNEHQNYTTIRQRFKRSSSLAQNKNALQCAQYQPQHYKHFYSSESARAKQNRIIKTYILILCTKYKKQLGILKMTFSLQREWSHNRANQSSRITQIHELAQNPFSKNLIPSLKSF